MAYCGLSRQRREGLGQALCVRAVGGARAHGGEETARRGDGSAGGQVAAAAARVSARIDRVCEQLAIATADVSDERPRLPSLEPNKERPPA